MRDPGRCPFDWLSGGRAPLPEGELLAQIQQVITEMPSYGYRRRWATLRRQAQAKGLNPANRKRIYRVMAVHGLLRARYAGQPGHRRHDGGIAADLSKLRRCSDGIEIACDNAEKVRVAFGSDCCDREAMDYVATTAGIKDEDVRDLMLAAVKQAFGQINRLPAPIEWLTDNGSATSPLKRACLPAISAWSP